MRYGARPPGEVGRPPAGLSLCGRHPCGARARKESSMRMASRMMAVFVSALVTVAGATGARSAVTVTWLDMSSAASFGSPVPNNSVFTVPGIGTVTMSYSIPANFTHVRQSGGAGFTSGSIGATSWSNYEDYSTIFTDGPDPLVPLAFTITYTFSSTLPPGSVYFGSIGLGQTSSFGGGASVYTV